MTPSGAELLNRAEMLRGHLLERQAEAERLRRLPGSRALFESNELQRCFRDVHAVASRTTRLGAIGRAFSGGEV
ncbi:MAG: hypothetical protein JO081_11025 [Alphaproteobacteria bacterium]|nr:hypothetical protein [Alphaproteobacteria bacterium]